MNKHKKRNNQSKRTTTIIINAQNSEKMQKIIEGKIIEGDRYIKRLIAFANKITIEEAIILKVALENKLDFEKDEDTQDAILIVLSNVNQKIYDAADKILEKF
jgi:hypothetical protein